MFFKLDWRTKTFERLSNCLLGLCVLIGRSENPNWILHSTQGNPTYCHSTVCSTSTHTSYWRVCRLNETITQYAAAAHLRASTPKHSTWFPAKPSTSEPQFVTSSLCFCFFLRRLVSFLWDLSGTWWPNIPAYSRYFLTQIWASRLVPITRLQSSYQIWSTREPLPVQTPRPVANQLSLPLAARSVGEFKGTVHTFFQNVSFHSIVCSGLSPSCRSDWTHLYENRPQGSESTWAVVLLCSDGSELVCWACRCNNMRLPQLAS